MFTRVRSPTWLFFVDSVFANWLPSEPSLSSAKWGCSRTGLLVCASCFACLFPLKMDYPNISVAPVRVKWRRSSASFRPYGSKLGRALKRSCRLLAETHRLTEAGGEPQENVFLFVYVTYSLQLLGLES